MVMYRRGVALMEQEDIAYELGLTVPEKDVYLFKNVRTGKMPSSGWGTQIQKREYSLPKFFAKHKIDLSFTIQNEFRTADDLRLNLQQLSARDDVDVLLCFDYGILWNLDFRGGHVCVLESVKGDTVHIIDPERNVPKHRETNVEDLFRAIDFHGSHNATGVWVISSDRV